MATCKKPFYSNKPNRTKKLNYLEKYPIIKLEDQLPVNIISPDITNGPWIAGGACMHWYQDKQVGASDIDVFCKSAERADTLIKYMREELDLSDRGALIQAVVETPNAVTFELSKTETDRPASKWFIQVIRCKYYDTVQDVINGFDISVCKIATAGNEWIVGKNAIKDLNERVLRFDRITKYSPKRLIKYWTYGFIPSSETIQHLTNNNNVKWDFTDEPEYDQQSI